MSNPRLPPEILDHIVDLLHDNPKTLEQCCLTSKSWVTRARKHLFADIEFLTVDDLKSWKKTFPDPGNSPAYHTRAMTVKCALGDGQEDGWTQSFSRIECLRMDFTWTGFSNISLVPFRKFSASLKSLHVASLFLPHPQVFSLIRFLPHLEDLTLIGYDSWVSNGDESDGPPTIASSASPPLTGTLELSQHQGMEYTARRLLDLPKGLHFQKLNLSWCDEGDLHWMVELVVACSNTLERLDVVCQLNGAIYPVSLLDR